MLLNVLRSYRSDHRFGGFYDGIIMMPLLPLITFSYVFRYREDLDK